MILPHRSSSRLRSTMWSRTNSPGLSARNPEKVCGLPYIYPGQPPVPIHGPLPGSLGLVSCATHTKSPTCSLRTVWGTCSLCNSRSISGLCPALVFQERRPESGQVSTYHIPASSSCFQGFPYFLTLWSHQCPHTTALCTRQALAPVVSAGCPPR